jgi:hypothetical protein
MARLAADPHRRIFPTEHRRWIELLAGPEQDRKAAQ